MANYERKFYTHVEDKELEGCLDKMQEYLMSQWADASGDNPVKFSNKAQVGSDSMKHYDIQTKTLSGVFWEIAETKLGMKIGFVGYQSYSLNIAGLVYVKHAENEEDVKLCAKLMKQDIKEWQDALGGGGDIRAKNDLKKPEENVPYTKTVDVKGQLVKYERELLDIADVAMQSGNVISHEESVDICLAALDGGRVTPTEMQTLKYIMGESASHNYKLTDKAKNYLKRFLEAVSRPEPKTEKDFEDKAKRMGLAVTEAHLNKKRRKISGD